MSRIKEIVEEARDRGYIISEEMVEDLLFLHCQGSYLKLHDRLEKIFREYGETLKEG